MTAFLHECVEHVKQVVKQEVGEMVQAAVEQAVTDGGAVASTATKPLLQPGPVTVGAAAQQSTQQQQGTVHWARFQSMLQRMDNNLERLVLSAVNKSHNYGYQNYANGPQLVWPRHNGEPVPAVLVRGVARPDNIYSVKQAPASVIDAMLLHYELPHGKAGGELENRRRALMRHIGVIKGSS